MSDSANLNTATASQQPQLIVRAAESFTYAAWQNSVALLNAVSIENPTVNDFTGLSVEFSTTPAFAHAKRWLVDRVGGGQTMSLREVDVEIDAAYLERLDEAERGKLNFQLRSGNTLIAEASLPVRVLARDEWGGMGTMAELLPAFVTPNDPALAALLKSSSDVLGDSGHSTALDGYQSRDQSRVYLLAAALWSAISKKALTYANPPPSFETQGQKTRRASVVLGDGLATCLDTTLLFASGLEAMGLNPVIVMTSGHCFVGVWLVEKTLGRFVERECSELRKAIAAREFIAFETTMATGRSASRFPDAVAAAEALLSESREHEFVGAVDVARGRMAQVRPLATHGSRGPGDEADRSEEGPLLPEPPAFNRVAVDDIDPRPQTPAGRVDRWQRKLLDLSLRNRLLNFRATKQTVPVLCPDLARLEDRLADGGRLRMISLREETRVASRDPALHQERTRTDLEVEFARKALEKNELACSVEEDDLEARLTTLFRKGKNDLAEGGSSTIYLAVGFLRWRPAATDEKTLRAPLLLVPVQLIRRSASSPFYLASHEDDVRFNATLLQLLKKDFGCDLTAMDTSLPTDDSGVDVPKVFERMRQAVRDIPGFEVVEEAAIASFSFAKYLMWKDLVDRVGQLEHNRVVRHLVHDPGKAFVADGVRPMPQPHEIDTRYKPAEIVHPLPADSSQLAAVMAAAEGHDMVIVGPPGTGKSQTIANLIAQCMSIGKTVLFVAEKTAALDVVHRRLCEHGLAECCVELHSNKAERRRFLDQLEASWKRQPVLSEGRWDDLCERLRVRRDELNAYVAAAHLEHPNGWTVHRAMGACVYGRNKVGPALAWPAGTRHDRATYESLKATVADAASAFAAIPAEASLERVHAREWSIAWETSLLNACRELQQTSDTLRQSLQQLAPLLGIPEMSDASAPRVASLYRLAHELSRVDIPSIDFLLREDLDGLKNNLNHRAQLLLRRDDANEKLATALRGFAQGLGIRVTESIHEAERRPLYRLANELVKSTLPPSEVVFHSSFDSFPTLLAERAQLLRDQQQALAALEARAFTPSLLGRVPLDQLRAEWAKANSAVWPLSLLKKSVVTKRLKSFMSASAAPDPDLDLPLLVDLKECQDRLVTNLASLGLSPGLQKAVEGSCSALDSVLADAKRIREAIQAAGTTIAGAAEGVAGSIETLLASAKSLYSPGRTLEASRSELREHLSTLSLPADLKSRLEDAPESLSEQIDVASRLKLATAALGLGHDASAKVQQAIANAPAAAIRTGSAAYCQVAKAFQNAWQAYTALAESTPCGKESLHVIEDSRSQAIAVLERRTLLRQWTAWEGARRRATEIGVGGFASALKAGDLPANEAVDGFELAYARWWLTHAVDSCDALRSFQRFRHEAAIEDFRQLDSAARKSAAARILSGIHHGLPSGEQVPRKSELGLIRHQMGLKRPSRSIREMIAGMPESFSKLAPCLLMSPLSIAQYLPTGQAPFDVVVFDEASQIATWDAIGAIARGKQTIIVGDPKQLPPTNFFGKADSDEDNDEIEDFDKDLESILDEARAAGLPTVQLNWHYRSRHESLIAFSNKSYYGNQLVTFPAAESKDRGVSLTVVEQAVYDRGNSRTNRLEADAIVADAVARMKQCMARPESERLTYGVVTFNSQQQSLIQDLFDDALRDAPELEWFFADERIEPTAVKNLENVQGDERDVMYFSITFGKDASGKFPVDFGAINRDGGERRLNVAVTRARRALCVYSSFLPDQLRAERSSARGVHDLKAFLAYAHKGPEPNSNPGNGLGREVDSPLELAIAAALESRGWKVDMHVGVSGFKVDLGILHPDESGTYLAGVECDGTTYHRLAAARDRDKTRQQVLSNLGWHIIRVWSPDWWHNPEAAIEDLHAQLTTVLQEARDLGRVGEVTAVTKADTDPAPPQGLSSSQPPSPPETPQPSVDSGVVAGDTQTAGASQIASMPSTPAARPPYRVADLEDASSRQSRFFDEEYSQNLREMALAVIEAESPVRDDVVARRVARAHGFGRTTAKISERVWEVISDVHATKESVGQFLWASESASDVVLYRPPAADGERRSLDEIAIQELIGLVRSVPDLSGTSDAALRLAREIGLARIAKPARERLEAALEAAASFG